MIEKLRNELHESIINFGTKDERTIKKSQELDTFIMEEMIRMIEKV